MNSPSPSEQIRALVCGYPHTLWPEKLLVMLQAYVDESVSETGDKRYFLCAYVANASEWEKFSNDWASALQSSPSITHLHMSEAWALNGEFATFDRDVRDKKLISLGKVIEKYRPLAIEVSVSRISFDTLFRPAAPFNLKNPYFICFYALIINLAKVHRDMGKSLPVDFIFDETNCGAETVMWYDYIKSHHPELSSLLGSTPIFRNDVSVMPLQAADMLAWHLRRSHEGRNENLPALCHLIGVFAQVIISDEHLQSIAQQFAKIEGVSQVQDRGTWRKLRPLILDSLATRNWPIAKRSGNFFERMFKRFSAFISR